MQGPQFTAGGRTLTLGTDGNVYDATIAGAWTSTSDQKDNQIRYTLDGVQQTPVAAAYSFNGSNQLVMTVGGGAAFTFVGGIEVDDEHRLNYFLVDNTGARTGVSITLYGDLGFAQASNDLSVALTGGGTAEVAGMNGVQSLKATQNTIASFNAADLLEFQAETDNDIGTPDFLTVRAVINFVGDWDIQNGGLVFMSNIKAAPAGNQVGIAFAGALKGVTVGFAYFADGSDPASFALNITGQHVFQKSTLSWQSSIGYSAKTFRASVNVDSTHTFSAGQTLTLGGTLTLQNADGSPHPEMQLELQAKYAFNANKILTFQAVITDGSQLSYDLMLTGTFQYSDLNLTFSLDVKDSGGLDVKVSVGLTGDRNSMIQNLALVLDVSEAQATVQLSLQFTVRLDFVDGQRVQRKVAAA